eukprot:scaffold78515_cov46-Attheya_sp.AAC.4
MLSMSAKMLASRSGVVARATSNAPVVSSMWGRSFASDAAAHRPPLDLYGLHARYANATFTAASKAGKLDIVESELLAIKASSENSKEFRSFLENPLISRDSKSNTLSSILTGKTSPITTNLMTMLADNARLSEVGKIVDTYISFMKAKRGEVEATIISADDLTKAQIKSITLAMTKQVGVDGGKVVLSTKVDPSILGGLQVQIGDKFLDLSVASRIDAVSRTVV